MKRTFEVSDNGYKLAVMDRFEIELIVGESKQNSNEYYEMQANRLAELLNKMCHPVFLASLIKELYLEKVQTKKIKETA
jgi:hypothetical protein